MASVSLLKHAVIQVTPRQVDCGVQLNLCVNAGVDRGYAVLTFELLWNHAGVIFKQIAWETKGELC